MKGRRALGRAHAARACGRGPGRRRTFQLPAFAGRHSARLEEIPGAGVDREETARGEGSQVAISRGG